MSEDLEVNTWVDMSEFTLEGVTIDYEGKRIYANEPTNEAELVGVVSGVMFKKPADILDCIFGVAVDEPNPLPNRIITALRPYLNDGKRVEALKEALSGSSAGLHNANTEWQSEIKRGETRAARIVKLESALRYALQDEAIQAHPYMKNVLITALKQEGAK